jgi:hypothetical protein
MAHDPNLDRRRFAKLAAAAVGGLVAGTAAADEKKEDKKNPLLTDKHVCRGLNTCKGKGECHVPLKKGTWAKARKRFEELMAKDGKKIGKAPDAK